MKGRLVSSWRKDGSTNGATIQYTYHAVSDAPIIQAIHTYNAANRMLTVNGVSEFTYDANGNMTQSGAQGLVWDIRGQLRSVGGSSFSYDAFGRRTVKTEPLVQGGTQTRNYGWTGWSVAQTLWWKCRCGGHRRDFYARRINTDQG